MVLLHRSRTITVHDSTVERYQTQLDTGGVQEPLQHPRCVSHHVRGDGQPQNVLEGIVKEIKLSLCYYYLEER